MRGACGLLLALGLMTASAATQALAWPHGRLFSNVYVPVAGTGQEGELIQQAQGALLQYDPRFSETQSASFNLLGLYYTATADPQMERSELQFREGYYRYSRNGIELRAGRQIISWGKSDVITPTDFLLGQDFRRFTPAIEGRRIGADGVQVSWVPNQGDSAWNFTGVWNLDFARSTLLLPPGATTTHSQLLDPTHPPVTFENSEAAIKGSYIQSSWDISLSYFRGWNHTPQLTKDSVTGGLDPLVSVLPAYTRIQAVGFDMSYSFEKLVWKFESAYTKTDNDDASTAMYQPSHLDAVMGLERPFGEKWRVQAQATARYFPRYRDPISETGVGLVDTTINRAVAKANALAQGYDRSWKAGATLRIAYGNEESDWNPEVFVISYPATDEILVRPRLLYRLTSSLQLDGGLERYFGPSDTVIGRYKPFSAYFLEARYLF